MLPTIVTVCVILVWVAAAGAVELTLGRAVAVARRRQGRGGDDGGRSVLGRVVTTTDERPTIVRSR